MNVAAGSHPEPALEPSCKVSDDVAEHIVGDNHVELARVADHLRAEGVHVHVLGRSLRIFRSEFFEHTLPQAACVSHGVRFVAHENAAAGRAVSFLVVGAILKRVSDDAPHSFQAIQVLLNSHFVFGSFVGDSPAVNVWAFGVFPDYDEVNVFRLHPL